MKALPSLFVGLAALLAGCSSWNNRQQTGLAGPQPLLRSDLPIAGDATDATPDSAVVTGRAGSVSPSPLPGADDGSNVSMTGRSEQVDIWHSEYESQQRRPIQTLRVGEGDRRVLITGSLRGDDPASVWLLDALAARLTAETVAPPASRYLLLRTPNPDGLVAAQSFNANGVDLNRNFPTLRYLRTSDNRSGSFPASEPETRIILRLLNEFQPDCVVQVRTAEIPAMRVFVNSRGESTSGGTLDELRVERGRFNEIAAGGSLEEFASQRLQAETMTIVVPASTARRSTTVDTLLALCGAGTPVPPATAQPPGGGAQSAPGAISANRGPAALTGTLEPIDQDGAYGNVELLPPPPGIRERDDRSGFYELPPPL